MKPRSKAGPLHPFFATFSAARASAIFALTSSLSTPLLPLSRIYDTSNRSVRTKSQSFASGIQCSAWQGVRPCEQSRQTRHSKSTPDTATCETSIFDINRQSRGKQGANAYCRDRIPLRQQKCRIYGGTNHNANLCFPELSYSFFILPALSVQFACPDQTRDKKRL